MPLPRVLSAMFAFALVFPAASAATLWEDIERALYEATVVVGTDCAGVLADGPDLVFTAAHCVHGQKSVELTFSNGAHATGWVAAVDRVTDQALLVLEEPVPITPLMLARRHPIAGTILYFAGHPSALRFREVKLQRVGRWPSLPLLQHALFTTIVGVPGDAGAPIVNTAGRVVGIIHGGRQYEVGTPVRGLRRLVTRVLGAEVLPSPLAK